MRPAPPGLLQAALTALRDPQSTQQLPDTTGKSLTGKAPSMGPQMLWVLLAAGTTVYRDPATSMTEGRYSPEVRQAIFTFVLRPDQTAESLSETIRALALSQAQDTAINEELLRSLDSTDPVVLRAILSHLATLTLTPSDFASARAHVTQLAASTDTPIDIQKLAKVVLSCWSNDRHHDVCPPPGT